MEKINGTFGNMLYKVQLQRKIARDKAREDILKRNNLTEKDLKGPKWRLEELMDSRAGAEDLIEFKLYKLEDATSVYIEGKVRAVVENGVENLPAIKNAPPF